MNAKKLAIQFIGVKFRHRVPMPPPQPSRHPTTPTAALPHRGGFGKGMPNLNVGEASKGQGKAESSGSNYVDVAPPPPPLALVAAYSNLFGLTPPLNPMRHLLDDDNDDALVPVDAQDDHD